MNIKEFDGICLKDSTGHGIMSIVFAVKEFNSIIYYEGEEEYKFLKALQDMITPNIIEIKPFDKNLKLLSIYDILSDTSYDWSDVFGQTILKSTVDTTIKLSDGNETIFIPGKLITDTEMHGNDKFNTRGSAQDQSLDFEFFKGLFNKTDKVLLAQHFSVKNDFAKLQKQCQEFEPKMEIIDENNKLGILGQRDGKNLDLLNSTYMNCKGYVGIASTTVTQMLAFTPHKPMVILYVESDGWENWSRMTAHLPNVRAIEFKKEMNEDEANKLKSKIAIAMKELGLS